MPAGPARPADGAGHPAARPASLFLVFAAGFYDGLLSVALMFIASAMAVALNDGTAIPAGDIGFRALLLAVPFPYFGWCWTRGGQTLGMRAWRLRLQAMDGSGITWGRALLRYLAALGSWAAFGLGFLWLLGPARLSWHDRLSRTRIVRLA